MDYKQEDESSDDEDCPDEVELDKAWPCITSAKQAKEAAKKMYHSLPHWKLTHCIKLIFGGSPDLLGAARTSNMYFTSAEVADVAARALAELMGGVVEVSKAPFPRRVGG